MSTRHRLTTDQNHAKLTTQTQWRIMEHDEMYFVVDGIAITLDELGAAVICNVNQDGTVDWNSFDLIDWIELSPDQYQLYKAAVDFLQTYSTHQAYVK